MRAHPALVRVRQPGQEPEGAARPRRRGGHQHSGHRGGFGGEEVRRQGRRRTGSRSWLLCFVLKKYFLLVSI